MRKMQTGRFLTCQCKVTSFFVVVVLDSFYWTEEPFWKHKLTRRAVLQSVVSPSWQLLAGNHSFHFRFFALPPQTQLKFLLHVKFIWHLLVKLCFGFLISVVAHLANRHCFVFQVVLSITHVCKLGRPSTRTTFLNAKTGSESFCSFSSHCNGPSWRFVAIWFALSTVACIVRKRGVVRNPCDWKRLHEKKSPENSWRLWQKFPFWTWLVKELHYDNLRDWMSVRWTPTAATRAEFAMRAAQIQSLLGLQICFSWNCCPLLAVELVLYICRQDVCFREHLWPEVMAIAH